jgi:hypothetical protein
MIGRLVPRDLGAGSDETGSLAGNNSCEISTNYLAPGG